RSFPGFHRRWTSKRRPFPQILPEIPPFRTASSPMQTPDRHVQFAPRFHRKQFFFPTGKSLPVDIRYVAEASKITGPPWRPVVGRTAMNELDDATLRDHFLGWQCRIRQIAMRRDGGRPSAGMRPRVLLAGGREVAPAVTVLLVPVQPEESTSFFRHQLRKSNDPRLVYERVLEYLQGTHFQQPRGFSDEMTAVFAPDSDVARVLLDAGECI